MNRNPPVSHVTKIVLLGLGVFAFAAAGPAGAILAVGDGVGDLAVPASVSSCAAADDAIVCSAPYWYEWTSGWAKADRDTGALFAAVPWTYAPSYSHAEVGSWFHVDRDGWYMVTWQVTVTNYYAENSNARVGLRGEVCWGSASDCGSISIPAPDDPESMWTFSAYAYLYEDYNQGVGVYAWAKNRPTQGHYGAEGAISATVASFTIEPYTGETLGQAHHQAMQLLDSLN